MNNINNMSLINICKNISQDISSGKQLKELDKYLINYMDNDYLQYVEFKNDVFNKKMIYSDKNIDAYIISWTTNSSKIHNHPQNGCLLKCLSGKLIEELYLNEIFKQTFQTKSFLQENDIIYRSGSRILHKILPQENSVTLHIYSPPDFKLKYY